MNTPPPHGTDRRYTSTNQPCRCTACRAAHNTATRNARTVRDTRTAQLRAQLRAQSQH